MVPVTGDRLSHPFPVTQQASKPERLAPGRCLAAEDHPTALSLPQQDDHLARPTVTPTRATARDDHAARTVSTASELLTVTTRS